MTKTPSTLSHDDAPAVHAIIAERAAAAVPVVLPDLTDAEAILALNDITERWVDVPEWGVRARVVALTGKERDLFELSLVETKGKSRTVNYVNLRARLVAASIRRPDDQARTVFNPKQVEALGNKNAAALQRVFGVARELSGLTDDDVDELTEELGNDQSDASLSA